MTNKPNLQCPQCHNPYSLLVKTDTVYTYWDISNGKPLSLTPRTMTTQAYHAECDCGYCWVVEGVEGLLENGVT